METFRISLGFKSSVFTLDVSPDETFAQIKFKISSLVNVAAETVRLFHPLLNKLKISDNDKISLALSAQELQQLETSKILVIGATRTNIQQISRENNILAIKKTQKPVKAYQDVSISYFGELKVLPNFSDSQKALLLLKSLQDDAGIKQIMRKFNWKVGSLCELSPAEKHILGFNVNAGLQISIRLRTDEYDGFRDYKTIVKVLLHELAHMKFGDHDNNFKEFNSLLNRLYIEYSFGQSVTGYKGEKWDADFVGDCDLK